MRHLVTFIVLAISYLNLQAQTLPGFKFSGSFDEQQLVIENSPPSTRILINAPVEGFEKNDRVLLVFYALPNGNTIEQTVGKILKEGDDWHYNIQHIGAQTRFLRQMIRNRTIVTVYLEAAQKSWPSWVASTHDSIRKVKTIVDDIKGMFAQWNPEIVLNGHSGGGRFIFSYLNASTKIPSDVVRIAFLDSSYGYEDSVCGPKLRDWLKTGKNRYLCTLAYNDSVVIYNGKQLVSPTGGTWYRSRMILHDLSATFRFNRMDRDSLIWNTALKKRVEIILKTNPGNKIYHSTQVELNGFIHSMLNGTRHENKGYAYFGQPAYTASIADSVVLPIRRLNIPVRRWDAETGTDFMKRIAPLPLREREEEIFRAISSGNVPDFLRNTVTLKGEFRDSAGVNHELIYEAMPDYLAVGNDHDFCRIPMNPNTAQRLADLFGGSLLTAKLSDHIYRMAEVKLPPFNYIPIGNANELVSRFEEHNREIEQQFREAGGTRGQLVAGIKKDVILAPGFPVKPGKVVIYGWHKPDGQPIQPVYGGHVDWYVDYSHGIRLINNSVVLDGKSSLFSELLKDPEFRKMLSP